MRSATRMTLALLIAAAGCGGSSTAPGSGNNINTGNNNPPPQNGQGSTSDAISVNNNYFDPTATTVPVGTKVTWTWNACESDGYGGQTCVSHGIVFDDGAQAPSQTQGTWTRTFSAAGTYKYHCSIHGASMAGTITVQ
jgi:plastocyanin